MAVRPNDDSPISFIVVTSYGVVSNDYSVTDTGHYFVSMLAQD